MKNHARQKAGLPPLPPGADSSDLEQDISVESTGSLSGSGAKPISTATPSTAMPSLPSAEEPSDAGSSPAPEGPTGGNGTPALRGSGTELPVDEEQLKKDTKVLKSPKSKVVLGSDSSSATGLPGDGPGSGGPLSPSQGDISLTTGATGGVNQSSTTIAMN